MAQFLDLFLACGARGTRRADVGVELPVGVVELKSEQIFALVVEQIFVLALVEQIFLQSIYIFVQGRYLPLWWKSSQSKYLPMC